MSSKKITIKLANGDEATGTILLVPGWEHIRLLLARAGEGIKGYTVYEVKTGIRLVPIERVLANKEEAIEQSLKCINAIEEKGGMLASIDQWLRDTNNGKPLNDVQPIQRRLI